ncbi:MAG: hypothetical protein IH991_04415, partial [Planctomycetes bacterium]|nr:hypothetical protein [Planctomycetota bacterium]
MWDDDPGPIEQLSFTSGAARTSHVSDTTANVETEFASHNGTHENQSVSDEDILDFIESDDPPSESGKTTPSKMSFEEAIANRIVNHLKSMYSDRMLGLFKGYLRDRDLFCSQSATGELSLVEESNVAAMAAFMPSAVTDYLETEFTAPKLVILKILRELLSSHRIVQQFCNTFCEYWNSVLLARGEEPLFEFGKSPAACINFLYPFCIHKVFPNSGSDSELVKRLEAHPNQVAKAIDYLLSDLDMVVDPFSARE